MLTRSRPEVAYGSWMRLRVGRSNMYFKHYAGTLGPPPATRHSPSLKGPTWCCGARLVARAVLRWFQHRSDAKHHRECLPTMAASSAHMPGAHACDDLLSTKFVVAAR